MSAKIPPLGGIRDNMVTSHMAWIGMLDALEQLRATKEPFRELAASDPRSKLRQLNRVWVLSSRF
jgi:hypothetical protein